MSSFIVSTWSLQHEFRFFVIGGERQNCNEIDGLEERGEGKGGETNLEKYFNNMQMKRFGIQMLG